MKINVVKDRSGKVVATFETTGGAMTMTPVLNPGERVEEMEVHPNYHENLAAFYAAEKK